MRSLVMYSKCLAQNLSKEQMIDLSAMLLLKVHLYLILFITVPSTCLIALLC